MLLQGGLVSPKFLHVRVGSLYGRLFPERCFGPTSVQKETESIGDISRNIGFSFNIVHKLVRVALIGINASAVQRRDGADNAISLLRPTLQA